MLFRQRVSLLNDRFQERTRGWLDGRERRGETGESSPGNFVDSDAQACTSCSYPLVHMRDGPWLIIDMETEGLASLARREADERNNTRSHRWR